MDVYGKIRPEDLPMLKSVVEIFRKHNLKAGLHGTSLWNPRYKDVDVLVVSVENKVNDFYSAFEEVKRQFNAKVLEQKGNETVGLDYDVEIGKLILHLSYVVLL